MKDWFPTVRTSPWFLFAVLIVLLILGEGAVMLILYEFGLFGVHSGGEVGVEWLTPRMVGLLDASILALVSAPFLYLLLVGPLRREITRRRRSEQKLKQELTRTRRLFEATGHGLLRLRSDGTIDIANERAKTIFRFSTGELENTLIEEILPVAWQEIKQELQDASSMVKTSDLTTDSFLEARARDGATVPVQVRFSRTPTDDQSRYVVDVNDVSDRLEREQELRLKERAMNETGEGIVITDPDQDDNPIIFANDGFEELTGYNADEIVGRNCRFLQGPDTDDQTIDEIREAVDQGESITTTIMNYRKDGTTFWNRLSISPVRNGSGTITHFVGVQNDITRFKEVEEELRSTVETLRNTRYTRDYLRDLIDTLPGGFFTLNPDGDITMVNRRLCEILGYSEEELLRHSVADIVDEVDSGALQELVREKEVYRGEKHFVSQDGETRPVLFSGRAIRDDNGDLDEIIGVGVDITERKQAEERLRTSEERFRQLANSIDEVFWIAEPDWSEFLYVNPAYEAMIGRSREVLLDEDPTDFLNGFHPEDREQTREYMQQLSSGEDVDYEVRVNPTENFQRWAFVHGRVLKDEEGRVQRILGTAQDITNQKQAEGSLQEHSESLETLYEILSDSDASLLSKLQQMLEEGCKRLGLDVGYITDIGAGVQNFRAVYSPEGRLDQESTVQLEETYCRETMECDDVLCVNHASEEGWKDDPAYEQFGFESYIARALTVGEDTVGTVCWAGYQPADFSELDRAYVELMSQLVRYEVKQKQALDELNGALEEKNTLLQEVHHRVKNNMQVISSMLRMQSTRIDDRAVRHKLEESLSRVDSMAMVHRLLYQSDNLEEVEFADYADQLLDHLQQTFENGHRDLSVEQSIDDVTVDLDTAIPCGLILTELISNAYQHAFEERDWGSIDVSFQRDDGTYRLSVEDNGVGLPEGFEIGEAESLGFELIQALVRSNLRGTLTIDSEPDRGTNVQVTFPSQGGIEA